MCNRFTNKCDSEPDHEPPRAPFAVFYSTETGKIVLSCMTFAKKPYARSKSVPVPFFLFVKLEKIRQQNRIFFFFLLPSARNYVYDIIIMMNSKIENRPRTNTANVKTSTADDVIYVLLFKWRGSERSTMAPPHV